jgi:hypothetical protein
VVSLPPSARLACWFNAWLAGRRGTDATLDGLLGSAAALEFVGPEAGSRTSPAEMLARLRRDGLTCASIALPEPGDPLGLGGPPAFNTAAIDAREAVVLHGMSLGLVPVATTSVISWRVLPSQPAGYLASVAEASRDLRHAMRAAADQLVELDVVSWRPEVADALIDLRGDVGASDGDLPFPDSASAGLAAEGLRAWRIVSLATVDDGGATTAFESDRRTMALRPLARAARAAICSAVSGSGAEPA